MILRRPIIRLLVSVPLCGLLVAGLLATAWLALGRPTPAQGAIWFEVTKTGTAEFSGAPDQPFFFLALGNDGRTDADKGLGDAIHVVGVNPASHQATIINVPRDTQAPGGDKINAYHSLDGLPGIISQLNTMMGIDIQYAVTTNFPGFSSMVDDIGGIDINIPPMTEGDKMWNDEFTGAGFPGGPTHIDGQQALALARDRHDFEITGDVSRTGIQALIIISALTTLRAQNPGDAGTLHLAAILAKHVRTQNVSLVDMFRLGRLALSIDPNNVKNITIPVGSGSGSNLVVGAGADALFADFRDDGIVQSR
jgi:polyisoprenyl-teichoic acid--peptidoglycan teichoic acid transferase